VERERELKRERSGWKKIAFKFSMDPIIYFVYVKVYVYIL